MAKITVPQDERPAYAKYVAYAVIGIFLVNAVVGTAARGADSPVLGLVVLLIAGVLNVGVVFLMVQSLVEEWFDAAEIIEE
jgi:Na+-driven multidrug efflux pump